MTETKRPRRSTEGGYARGEETRLRIIQAAIELFGEHGFVAASTRDIAAKAGVNAPALQYYFENKEGVYRACAEHLADEVWSKFEPVVQRSAATLETADDDASLIEAFIELQDVMMDKALQAPSAPALKLFFVREQGGQEPQIATDIIQERVRRPLNKVATRIIAKICGTAPDNPLATVRLIALHGQFSLFQMAPRSMLTLLGWSSLDAEKIAFVKQTVFSNSRALLQMWATERAATGAAAHCAADDKPEGASPRRKKAAPRGTARG
ncbi:CerR family C-terminal domain-containing protein [Trinickia dinghuensis]|uniref:CerR family C-terminal domain-containing protein n=1 Tax=Trinickia dinghuensis TaxID=2291023 RepID=UPI001FE24466|nr:CerR family C-terminal domain-containing protein [Trinickia dinghuensis]